MTNKAEEMSEETENQNPGDETTVAQNADNEAELQADDAVDLENLFDGTDRLAELEAQVAELNDKLLRAVAETENVRRRAQREKDDASKYAIASFAGDMVSVADNLTRALGSMDAETRAADETVENLMAGVEITLRDLLNTFERTGIKRIEAMDKPFDHNLHEAMFEMEDPAKPSGTVVQVIQEGYTIRDRLLRPTKVGVSKGGPTAQAGDDTGAADQADDGSRENAPDQTKAYEKNAQNPGAQVDEEL